MQTQEKPIQIVREPRSRRPRRLIPVLAGVIAVIVIAVGVVALTGNDEPDVTNDAPVPTTVLAVPSPLDVTNLYNGAVATGDWTALRELYADTAELEIILSGEAQPKVRLIDYVALTPYDWDGDGLVDGFDALIDDGARQHAAGTTIFVSCSQVDAVTAVCDEVQDGYAFKRLSLVPTTWTLTIVDGVITTHSRGIVRRSGAPYDTNLLAQYNKWVSDKRPELEQELFEDRLNLAITPDTVGTHRELVAEWQAQR